MRDYMEKLEEEGENRHSDSFQRCAKLASLLACYPLVFEVQSFGDFHVSITNVEIRSTTVFFVILSSDLLGKRFGNRKQRLAMSKLTEALARTAEDDVFC